MAAQLMGAKVKLRRGLLLWMALAMSSLPVPDSPVMRTLALVGATSRSCSKIRFMRGLAPMMPE